MGIRPALTDDVPVLDEIVERAYRGYVERIGARPGPMDDDYAEKVRRGHVFVVDDDPIRGLVVLIPTVDHLLIENVAVDPACQGTGVGRRLLAYAETYAIESGLAELRLYTHVKMTENLSLYPRLGYREYDRRTDDGFERVFFSKRVG